MFDAVFEKANQAVVQLNKSLSSFEKDALELKEKVYNQLEDYDKELNKKLTEHVNTSDNALVTLRENLEGIINNKTSEINSLTENFSKILNEKKTEFDGLSQNYIKSLQDCNQNFITSYSEEMNTNLRIMFSKYEEKAKSSAEKLFETDIINIFDKYGVKLIPLIFKAFFKYIFRIKKVP